MQIISSFNELKHAITKQVEFLSFNNPVISIDGYFGAGKTLLSQKLCDDLGYNLIHLDSPYLNSNLFQKFEYSEYKEAGGGILFIELDMLRDEIESSERPILLEGAYMENLLSHEKSIRRDLSIYIKRMAKSVGIAPKMWLEEDISKFDDLEKKIEKEKSIGMEEMREELIRYHYKYKPHLRADIAYENEHTES